MYIKKPYYNCLHFVKTTFDRCDLTGLTFNFHNLSVAKEDGGSVIVTDR